jgi:hypothetical protein
MGCIVQELLHHVSLRRWNISIHGEHAWSGAQLEFSLPSQLAQNLESEHEINSREIVLIRNNYPPPFRTEIGDLGDEILDEKESLIIRSRPHCLSMRSQTRHFRMTHPAPKHQCTQKARGVCRMYAGSGFC